VVAPTDGSGLSAEVPAAECEALTGPYRGRRANNEQTNVINLGHADTAATFQKLDGFIQASGLDNGCSGFHRQAI
jgi:hypothetical protein